jgi:hypothetical protein
MVAQNFSALRLTGEQADRINNQITRIKKLQEDVELKAKDWDQIIESLHSTCINLETGAQIERLIALAQGASDNIKRSNEIFLGSLHILESTEPLLRAGVDKLQNFEMQLAELDSLAKELSEKAPFSEPDPSISPYTLPKDKTS